MKIFALVTVLALLGGSQAFLGEVSTLFHNLGAELKDVGKDLVHVAEPVATSLLQTLEKAGTQLLSTAASDLLSHLGTGASSTRDLSQVVGKVGQFVNKGKDMLKEVQDTLGGAYKYAVHRINEEVENVVNDVKPLSGLFDEVKDIVKNHNVFVDDLVSKILPEGEKLFEEAVGSHKRGLLDLAASFGQNLQHLVEEVANPLKTALGGVVTSLESKVMSLLG